MRNTVCAVLAACLAGLVLAATTATTASAEPAAAEAVRCKVSKKAKTHRSVTRLSLLVKGQLRLSWCYDGKKVRKAHATCMVLEHDTIAITIHECKVQAHPEPWGGLADGGFYVVVTISYSNCVFRYGCWANGQMNIQMWARGNGFASAR